MARKKPPKQPKHAREPQVSKTPKTVFEPPQFKGGFIAWRFNAVDKNGPFAWTNIESTKKFQEIIETLAHIETLSDNELNSKEHHFIPVEKLEKKAQQRLLEIKLDDLDALYSIRMNSKGRVFCVYRQSDRGCYMRVLWWDPEHQVCLSHKKHT